MHAVVLRSPHAHARFHIADLDRVRAMPGVRLVLTAADVAELGPLPTPGVLEGVDIPVPVYPILARDEVRHVGDAIAFVVADTLAAAKDAAEAITVDWQPLPHVIGAIAALENGAPQVWPDRPGNLAFETEAGDAAATKRPSREAARTVSLTIVNQRLVTNYLDTRGVIAEYDGERYTLTLGSQGSHIIRDIIAGDVLKIPPDKMRVITPDVGGGFGTKLFPYREYALAAVAAERLRKPVKWVGERTEHFLGDSHGRDNISTARLALDDKGRFLALELDIVADMGAYLSCYAPYIPWLGVGMATGAYDIPAAHVRLRGVYTNTVPVDAYRGAGRPEASYLIERVGRCGGARTRHRAGRAAPAQFHQAEGDALHDADRQDLRLRRFRRHHGARAGDRRLGRLQQARRAIEARRPAARHRACDLYRSLRRQRAGNRDRAARPRRRRHRADRHAIDRAGPRHLLCADRRRQARSCRRRKCAWCRATPTRSRPAPAPAARARSRSAASRSIAPAGSSPIRLKELAAEALEASAGDLEIADGAVRVAGTDRAISFADLAAHPQAKPERLRAASDFDPDQPTYPNGTHIAEVEIDPDTGATTILNYVIVDDFGATLNPLLLAGQVHGGTVQGIGQALMEDTVYDAASGQLLSASLMDYALPRAGRRARFRVRDPQRAVQEQSARRQRRGRGRRHRLLSGGHERGARCAVAQPSHPPSRHAGDARAGLAGDRSGAKIGCVLRRSRCDHEFVIACGNRLPRACRNTAINLVLAGHRKKTARRIS